MIAAACLHSAPRVNAQVKHRQSRGGILIGDLRAESAWIGPGNVEDDLLKPPIVADEESRGCFIGQRPDERQKHAPRRQIHLVLPPRAVPKAGEVECLAGPRRWA